MRRKGKILFGIMIWMLMMLGMVCTARAYDNNPYAGLVLNYEDNESTVNEKKG